MPFCTKCGTKLADDANFCVNCGAKVNKAAAPAGTPVQQPAQPVSQPVQSAPTYDVSKFSGIPVRYRCPNGHVFDGSDNQTSCQKCGAPIPDGGYIQIYRMGNPVGMAVGMGVYIDEESYGHLANKQSIRVKVPYGQHKVHIVHTATRKCNDPVFDITPQNPCVWCKTYFINGGWKIQVEEVGPDDMPTK